MNDSRPAQIARHLFEANAARAPFVWLTGDLKPTSLAEAYKAQSALLDMWEKADVGRIAGWKIALTSPAMQELCGIDHAFMPIAVRVVSKDQFDTWAAAAQNDLDEANQTLHASLAQAKKLAATGKLEEISVAAK